jgi:hypothetical protein
MSLGSVARRDLNPSLKVTLLTVSVLLAPESNEIASNTDGKVERAKFKVTAEIGVSILMTVCAALRGTGDTVLSLEGCFGQHKG